MKHFPFIGEIAKPAEPVNGKMNGAYAPPLTDRPPLLMGNQGADSKECCPPLTMFLTEYQPPTGGQRKQ